jgi:hypothetical protein
MFFGRAIPSLKLTHPSRRLTPLSSPSSPTAQSPDPLLTSQPEEQLAQRLDPNAPPPRARILGYPFSGQCGNPRSISLHRPTHTDPEPRITQGCEKMAHRASAANFNMSANNSFRMRTYTKRGRGWGSEKSRYISPETLTLPTRLTVFDCGQNCNWSGSTGVTSAYTLAPSPGNCILTSMLGGAPLCAAR